MESARKYPRHRTNLGMLRFRTEGENVLSKYRSETWVEQFAALTSPKMFTCEETTITFGGETWDVPQGDMPASSEYISKADHPEVSLAEDTTPFAFCGGDGSSLMQQSKWGPTAQGDSTGSAGQSDLPKIW